MFAAEARGLEALATATVIRTPAVLGHGTSVRCAFILLEWLDLSPLNHEAASILGKALAQLHRCFGDTYGWSEDTSWAETRSSIRPIRPGRISLPLVACVNNSIWR